VIASTVGDIGTLVGAIAAVGVVVGGYFAGRTALRQLGLQAEQAKIQADQAKGERLQNRGRWLTELSARFSDTPSFVAVREQLHFGEDSPLVRALKRRQEHEAGAPNELSDEDAKRLVALDDYLDFLGLIEYLVAHDYLDEDAAYSLFDWYVINQLNLPPINYEIKEGFGEVRKLRRRLADIRAKKGKTTPPEVLD
jgi:hypothetical protein